MTSCAKRCSAGNSAACRITRVHSGCTVATPHSDHATMCARSAASLDQSCGA
jgi:hypothetical protein